MYTFQRAIVTGDIHLRDGPFPEDLEIGLQILEDCAYLAKVHDTKVIIINGDLLHRKNDTPLAVLLPLYRKLESLRARGYLVVWSRGNHESPWKSDPHRTVMTLFSNVCHTVIMPKTIEAANSTIWILPWYEGHDFRRLLNEVRKKALLCPSRRKIVIAHIGVTEGSVSPSNFRVQQDVSLKDFSPDLFDLIILGDYHMHQYLGDDRRVVYLGSPIPLTFGDGDTVGPWLLDLLPEPRLTPLDLPTIYPKYNTYEIRKPEELTIPFYNHEDRNRIHCTPSMSSRVETIYPDAEIEYLEESTLVLSTGRLEGVTEGDYEAVFREFHASKGWDKTHMKLGLEYLRRCI